MPSPSATEMRKQLLILVASVIVVDVVAMGLFYGLHIKSASQRTQMIFSGVWTVATLIVVLRGLSRVRAARTRRRP